MSRAPRCALAVTAAVATGAIALGIAAIAVAGKTTINDGRDQGTPKCADIDTVKAKAGDQTTRFHVLMFGNIKARPCNGAEGYPSVGIDYGHKHCAVYGVKGTGTGPPGLYCGDSKVGSATIAIAPNDNKKWDLKFHTQDLPGKPKKFRFGVSTVGVSPGDTTFDSGSLSDGLVPIKIG